MWVWSLGPGKSLGGTHGDPLQYSCLENLMDRGAWWAKVLRVTKSWTRLKWLSVHARITSWFLLVKNLGMVFLGVLLLGHSQGCHQSVSRSSSYFKARGSQLPDSLKRVLSGFNSLKLLDLSYRSQGCWPGTSLGPLPHESLCKKLTTCQPGSSKRPSERTREKRVPTRQVFVT